MLWRVEIGTVVQTPTGAMWAPFARMTVPLEKVEHTFREAMARLTDTLAKTHGPGWELEKLVYVKVGALSPRRP